MSWIKTKKQFFITWLILAIGMSIALCYFTNKYKVSVEVKDGDGIGDWHYETIYYSVSEATINNLKENWFNFIIVFGVSFWILLRFVADSMWDEANKDRYGEGFNYYDRRNIDETLGVERFNPNKKKNKIK